MNKDYFISIYLDTRRAKKSGKYPVRLRVYSKSLKKQKLYPTKYEFTNEEFESIWLSKKPRIEHKEIRHELLDIELTANKIAGELKFFSFLQFEKQVFNLQSTTGADLENYYQKAIQAFNNNDQFSSASNYELSLKSLKVFSRNEKLYFHMITPEWLKGYERYMVTEKQRSITTVSIYLRVLRTVFNNAIYDRAVPREMYPFGKRKYRIPMPAKTKKALSKEQLKILKDFPSATPEQEMAKDFFFLSYACFGLNLADILNLQYKNVSNNMFTFFRKKSVNTIEHPKERIIYLTEFALGIIEKYGNKNDNPDTFVFPFYNNSLTPKQKHRIKKNFTRFVDQHIKKHARNAGLDFNLSSVHARHSFATNALRNGGSPEFIQDVMAHSDIKSTYNYLEGFEDAVKREFANKMMEL